MPAERTTRIATSTASRPLAIAVVTETFPPEVNGVARTVGLMVDWLLERGHSVELLRPKQRNEPVRKAHAALVERLTAGTRIPGYPQLQLGWATQARLRREWSRSRPDLVHIVTEGPLGWSAVGAARSLGIPLSSDFHTNFHRYTPHYGFGLIGNSVAAYLRSLHNRTACTIVPTREMKAELDGLRFERVLIAGRGVDNELFHPGRRSEALRREWGCHGDETVVLSVGRLAPEKALDVFAATAKALRLIDPAIRIVIVGDGPLRNKLERAHPDIHFAGERVGEDLAAHYASADLFLFPSVTETFGNVTLEAMASGLPVVAYDEAAAHQHMVHAQSGLLAPVGDDRTFSQYASLLARDRELRVALSQAAREAILPLTWHRAFMEMEAILLACLAYSPAVQAETLQAKG